MGKLSGWLAHEVPLREAAGNPVTELEAQAKQLAFRQQQPIYRAKFQYYFRLCQQCGDVSLPFQRENKHPHHHTGNVPE